MFKSCRLGARLRNLFPSRLIGCIAFFSALLCPPSLALADFSAQVLRIIDGDSIEVLGDDQIKQAVRLANIDAPEMGQPFGEHARDFLADLIEQEEVRVLPAKRDRYGRLVAQILMVRKDCAEVTCAATVDVNLMMISSGMGWWYRRFSAEQSRADRVLYEQAESRARADQVGLWESNDHVAPWAWREPASRPGNITRPTSFSADLSCQPVRTCAEMRSCTEAFFHLSACGNTGLDRDGNGVPCQSICRISVPDLQE